MAAKQNKRKTQKAKGKGKRTAKGRARTRPKARARATRTRRVVRRAAPKVTSRRKPASRQGRTAAKARKSSRKSVRKTAGRPKTRPAARPTRPRMDDAARASAARARNAGKPSLDRNRRVLSDDERFDNTTAAIGASTERMARSGHDHLRAELERHTESDPRLTAGDVDARWQDAYAVGDEAPGGDNPTPDQDRVDDIGRALGIQYQDDQELQGGDEVAERDKHRWELDPASSDDWPHDDKDQD